MDDHQRRISQQQPHVGGETILEKHPMIDFFQPAATNYSDCGAYGPELTVTQYGVCRGRPASSGMGTSVGEGSRTGELSSAASMLQSQSGACSQHLLSVFPSWRNTDRGVSHLHSYRTNANGPKIFKAALRRKTILTK